MNGKVLFGNAVLPKFMEAITNAVKKLIKKRFGENKSRKYTVISTFAGCGGSSLGYRWAGFRELLAIDFDRDAVETFRLNFPDVPVWQRDIREVTAGEVLEFCKIKKGELDVLDGSPPCQGFSTAGKRMVSDPRNDSFREFARLIDGLRPRAFVMENVSGMAKGRMRGMFIEVTTALKSLGYEVRCKLMNAMWYGVPQSRERLIWIGIRKNPEKVILPRYPAKTVKNVRTVRDAIYDLKTDSGDLNFNPKMLTAQRMKHVPPGGTDAVHYSTHKLNWNRPARTLTHDFLGYYHVWHPDQNRPLNLKEWSRLGSFPDDFKWPCGKKISCSLIGNSVPPRFMRAIAESVKKTVGDNKWTR